MRRKGGFFLEKKWKDMKSWIANKMDLPPDVFLDFPRITMLGQIHIYIENHRGLLKFTEKEVRLLLADGQLLIKGDGFVIKTILPEELLLEGKIEEVLFLAGDKHEK